MYQELEFGWNKWYQPTGLQIELDFFSIGRRSIGRSVITKQPASQRAQDILPAD